MNTRIIDGHCDTMLRVLDDGADLAAGIPQGHIDLDRLLKANVQMQFFALYAHSGFGPTQGLQRVLALLDALHHQCELNPELFVVRTRQDLDRLSEGRVGALIVVEGADFLTDLTQLRSLYRLGVRSMMLTWNGRNLLADGAGEPPQGGISPFGREVVGEMQRLGMVLDVSHLNERGFWDMLEISHGSLIASHSNARRLCDQSRNLYDDQLQALAARGGVAGLNFYSGFLTDQPEATIDDIIRHYEYIAGLVGPSHVALGTDYDGINRWPRELPDVASLARLSETFASRYAAEDVEAFLFGNLARVLRAVLPEMEVRA